MSYLDLNFLLERFRLKIELQCGMPGAKLLSNRFISQFFLRLVAAQATSKFEDQRSREALNQKFCKCGKCCSTVCFSSLHSNMKKAAKALWDFGSFRSFPWYNGASGFEATLPPFQPQSVFFFCHFFPPFRGARTPATASGKRSNQYRRPTVFGLYGGGGDNNNEKSSGKPTPIYVVFHFQREMS